MKVVVTGGTGFLGRRVVARLSASGHAVTVVTRDVTGASLALPAGTAALAWGGGAEEAVREADGLVNLAGEPIAQRWSSSVRERLVSSRVGTLERIRASLEGARTKPSALVSASAVGYYGDRGEAELDESSPPADDFLGRVCQRWEEAAFSLGSSPLGLRVAVVRVGVALGTDGGALAKMLPAFRLGGGGPIGSGRQWMSWISADDAAALFAFALENPGVSGVLAGTAPAPVRNAEFARALGRALSRPAILPVPAVALKLLFGEMGQIVLGGQKVLPKRTIASGFSFAHPSLEEALASVLAASAS